MAKLPAIWSADAPGTSVSKREAIIAWSDAAWGVLETVAARYGAFITYAELGRRLQRESGIFTSMPLEFWIRDALDPVVKRILADPSRAPLVSLAVQPDGDVARWYVSRGRPAFRTGDDRQRAAAHDRLACYRAHAGDVPDDARPSAVTIAESATATSPRRRPPLAAAPRAAGGTTAAPRAARRADDRPVAVCPVCNMQLRPDGGCDLCD